MEILYRCHLLTLSILLTNIIPTPKYYFIQLHVKKPMKKKKNHKIQRNSL